MSDTLSTSIPGAEKPAAPAPAAAKPRELTLPERIGQSLNDQQNEANHRPTPKK